MAIRKRAVSAIFGAVAAAAVVGLSAAPAMAMPATSLKAKVSGGGAITAKSTGKTILSDNGVSVTCSSSKASGKINNGTKTGAAPLEVGTTTKLSFTNCNGPLGKVTTTIEGTPYKISVVGRTNSKGNTDGIIGPVTVKTSMTGCSFEVTGYSPGYYSNSKHELVVTPVKGIKQDLTVKDVDGCAGLVKDGNHPTYTSTYKVNKHVKITVT